MMIANGLKGLRNWTRSESSLCRLPPRRGAGNGSPSIDPDDPLDAGGNSAGEIAGPEFRRDDLVDDALGGDVGERAFEAVADLDAQLAVVLGDDQQRAVVDLLAPDLPGLRDPDRILLDRLGLGGRHDQHRDLAALPRLEGLERLRQRRDIVRADSVPVWSTTRPVSGGTATSRAGREGPAQQQRQNGGSCSVHRGPTRAAIRRCQHWRHL